MAMMTSQLAGRSPYVLTPEAEIQLGRDAAPQIEAEYGGALPQSRMTDYINRVGHHVSKYSRDPKWPFEFKVLNSDIINAFALPGGMIYVTKGMLKAMNNEAQLAGVLGHEIGHVTNRHGAVAIENAMAYELVGGLISEFTGGELLAEVSTSILSDIFQNGYSRRQESQSDRDGLDSMYKAGYHPGGIVELMQIFQSMEEGEPDAIQQLFQSHPPSGERVETLVAKINSTYPTTPQQRVGANEYMHFVHGQPLTSDSKNGKLDNQSVIIPLAIGAVFLLLSLGRR
jgi:predicted Zn-dependent protease